MRMGDYGPAGQEELLARPSVSSDFLDICRRRTRQNAPRVIVEQGV